MENGVSANVMDDFGGGCDEGEPLEQDIVDKSPAKGALPLGEADGEDLEEQDDLDEADEDLDEMDQDLEEADEDLDQLGNRSKKDTYGSDVADDHESETWDKRMESVRARVVAEKRIQERLARKGASLKKEAKRNPRKVALLKKEYASTKKRYNESVVRMQKLVTVMTESKNRRVNRLNSGSKNNAKVNEGLRAKLAETNLYNAKLIYTNKLLQNESLSQRQKAQVIEQLDAAKTIREVKLVYTSLAKTLAGVARPIKENAERKVLGSSSRATRPASTQVLSEGYETDRWAQLAGINS